MTLVSDTDLPAARLVLHVSVPPQLDLGVGEAQLSQAGEFLLPILQRLELGQTAHSCRLFPKRLVQRSRGKTFLLSYAAVRTREGLVVGCVLL